MTDKSLEALHGEMRTCRTDQQIIEAQRDHLTEQQAHLATEREKLSRRQRILDETLRLHIYDQMPVLQAKMVATENVDAADAFAQSNTIIQAGAIVKGPVTNAQLAANQAAISKAMNKALPTPQRKKGKVKK